LKRIATKRALIITLTVILALLFVRVIFIESIMVTYTDAFNISDYDEFYLFSKKTHSYNGFIFDRSVGYKIWFLTGQEKNVGKDQGRHHYRIR